MEATIASLVDQLSDLTDEFHEIRLGVHKAIQIAEIDPDMALTRVRKVLEHIVRNVFERRIKAPPGTRPLENLLQLLVKEGHFPERVDAYANTIRKLGNVGTHNFGERITAEDVDRSLAHLMPVLEWYFADERPEAGVTVALRQRPTEIIGHHQTPSVKTSKAVSAPFHPAHAAVVPKGLRSFDASDSDSFLQLLPGPRGKDGLPQSIRFWKHRIEAVDELTFTVGVIYGPSGCGKSSLVRAGLLPRLSKSIASVYVEATADGTEGRLLQALKRRFPGLPGDLDLPRAIAALCQCQGLEPGQKALVAIDQFEQWLHARSGKGETELGRAIAQCDGEHVQCIVTVRDDFWIPLSRFMAELEIPLLTGENAALVDLFDLIHARQVLARFGEAFGRLPAETDRIAKDQETFLGQVVEGLSQDGRVISIRLALFAEMTKGMPWTPATLKAVGGMSGVGVTFLEETFNSTALKHHQDPAQSVLKALLPETGLNIKGHMRSYEELLAASGCADRPKEFNDLVQILNREVRLITPTSPEGSDADLQERSAANGTRYFQLTHDYLIAPLREWLARKRRETWRGRMELVLEERTAQWEHDRCNRFLPSTLEYIGIVCAGRRPGRTAQQRALLRAATRYYGIFVGLFAVLSTLALWGAWEANGRIQAQRLVQAIDAATPSELQKLLDDDLPPYRRWADRLLRIVANNESGELSERINASIALVPVDKSRVGFLADRLIDCAPAEFGLIRKCLEPSGTELVPSLWATLHDPERSEQARFHSGMALAEYSPQSSQWTAADFIFEVEQLLSSNPDNQPILRSYLRPIALKLLSPLHATFRSGSARESARLAAAAALADYGRDQPELLAELACEAIPEQYAIIFPVLGASERDRVTKTLALAASQPPAESLKEIDRVQFGRKRAGASITLCRLGLGPLGRDVFRVDRDPESLTQFVHGLKPRRVEPQALVEQLEQAVDDQIRLGLIFSLAEFRREELPAASRGPLVEKLLNWYRHDPSSSIHSACGSLLRRWGFESEVATVDQTPLPYDGSGRRQWFVVEVASEPQEHDYFTFIVFRPGEFQMGSPTQEASRDNDETPHRVRLTRAFAISDRELTQAQWRRFESLDSSVTRHGSTEGTHSDGSAEVPPPATRHSISANRPATGVNWSEAVKYCRWLTQLAGFEQCYEDLPRAPAGTRSTMPWKFHPERNGFRLPTEAEWEFAARAGTITSYSFGSDPSVLSRYAWLLDDAQHTTHEVAKLLPNLRGLFDVHGNAWEWCQDLYDKGYAAADVVDPLGPAMTDTMSHVARGGGWGPPLYCRSAYRSGLPESRLSGLGFRLACTLK